MRWSPMVELFLEDFSMSQIELNELTTTENLPGFLV